MQVGSLGPPRPLDEAQRREALEDLDYLAQQAKLEPEDRKMGLITTVLSGLGRVLTLADRAHTVFQEASV